MPWLTAIADLRTLISDGNADKLRYRKKILGKVDSVNTVFKTLEKRRLTNLKTETDATLGVFINGVRLSQVTGIVSDNPTVGEVNLTAAPAPGDFVESTYYIQWFLDSELTTFMTQAAQWLGFGAMDQIPPGLQPSAMYYGAQESYHKLALRWAETISDEFKLSDAPDREVQTPMDMYRSLANDAKKKSVELRDQFYSGKGEEKKGLSVSLLGGVRRVVPNR